MLYLIDNDPVVPSRYPDSVRYFLLYTSECTERAVLISLYCKFGLSPANGIMCACHTVTTCEASYMQECLFIRSD